MNTSKSLDEILEDFRKQCVNKVNTGNGYENTKQAIVEAVEGIYGDSDGLREFAGLNLIKPVPEVPSKREELNG